MSVIAELADLKASVERNTRATEWLAEMVEEHARLMQDVKRDLAVVGEVRDVLQKTAVQVAATSGEITGRFAVLDQQRQHAAAATSPAAAAAGAVGDEIAAGLQGLRIGGRRISWAGTWALARILLAVLVGATIAGALLATAAQRQGYGLQFTTPAVTRQEGSR